MDKLAQMKQVVENLKTDLDTYVEDLSIQVESGAYDIDDIENSEWFSQIADIYKAAHGSELYLK